MVESHVRLLFSIAISGSLYGCPKYGFLKLFELLLLQRWHHPEINTNLRSWFDLFKGLAFVPLDIVNLAFNFILSLKPQSYLDVKKDLFINYFTSTWLSNSAMFPPNVWNHYDTIGPRTNNHVEGFNFKYNQYSFCNHLNICQLIELFRQLETIISKKYIKRVKREHSKAYRRPIDVKKDDILSILQSLLFLTQ